MSERAGNPENVSVFISYSRSDLAFADQLVAALESIGFNLLIDRDDISAGEDWQARLGALIAQADTIVLLLSPTAAVSDRVAWEIAETDRLSKRLLPVIIKPLGSVSIPHRLQQLQQTFLYPDPNIPGSGFGKGLGRLVDALNTDIEWLREHTRLGQRSAEWHSGARQENRLLSGDDIIDALDWLARRPGKAPHPTEMHLEFIKASEKAQSARETAERLRLQKAAAANQEREQALARAERAQRQRERVTFFGIAVAVALSMVAGWNGWQASQAERIATHNDSRALTALSTVAFGQQRYADAVKLALAAWPRNSSSDRPRIGSVIKALASAQQYQRLMIPPLVQEQGLKGANFIGDESRILTWSDSAAQLWDAITGQPIGLKMQQEHGIEGALFNQDKNRLLTWSRNSHQANSDSLRLWSTEAGKQIGDEMLHEGEVWGATFNADGSRMLSWSADHTVRLWNTATGEPDLPPLRHREGVGGAIFNQDESSILSWAEAAYLWSAESGEPIFVLPTTSDSEVNSAESYVNGAMFNRDETRILAWSGCNFTTKGGGARLWDAATGETVGASMNLEDGVSHAIFNTNDTIILTWCSKVAHLWDAQTGLLIGQPMRHVSTIAGAVFSSDNSRVLTWTTRTERTSAGTTGAIFGGVKLWDATTGEELQSFPYRGVVAAAFDSNDGRILAWSEEGKVQIWDAETGDRYGGEMRHTGRVSGAVFNGDESCILSWSADGTARLWDVVTGDEILPPMRHDSAIDGAIFDRNESRILTWARGGAARLWDAATGQQMGQTMKHQRFLQTVRFNDDQTRIVSFAHDSATWQAHQWDANTGKRQGKPASQVQQPGIYGNATLNRDSSRLLAWSDTGNVHLLDAETNELLITFTRKKAVIGFSYIVNKIGAVVKALADNSETHRAGVQLGDTITHLDGHSLTDLTAKQLKDRLQGPAHVPVILSIQRSTAAEPIEIAFSGEPTAYPAHRSKINGAAFNRDETQILSWGADGAARLWDITNEEEVRLSMQHNAGVEGALFSPDETHILTWSEKGQLHLWDIETGKALGEEMRHAGSIVEAAFAGGGKRIFARSSDGTARFWETDSGRAVGEPIDCDGSIATSDKKRYLMWTEDGTARLWDPDSSRPIEAVMRHGSPIDGAIFSQDDTLILTWSRSELRLWNASDGRPVSDILRTDGVSGAKFNYNGTRFLTWGASAVRLWDTASGEQLLAPLADEKYFQGFRGAALSRDETRILAWNSNNIGLWDIARLPRGGLITVACEMLPDQSLSSLKDRYGIVIEAPICGPETPPAKSGDYFSR